MEVPREQVVVCDNGTGYVKCGFAGDNFPRAVFPCMVGRPTMRYEEAGSEQTLKDIMVGEDAAAQRNNLEVRKGRGGERAYNAVHPRDVSPYVVWLAGCVGVRVCPPSCVALGIKKK
jgi:hypothetical protein